MYHPLFHGVSLVKGLECMWCQFAPFISVNVNAAFPLSDHQNCVASKYVKEACSLRSPGLNVIAFVKGNIN